MELQTMLGGGLPPLLLRKMAARLDACAAGLVREHGLTVDRWRMLELLVARGPLSMAVLSEELSLTGPTASRVADRLVSEALAYRNVDPTDRRRVVLQVSKRGRTLHGQLAPEVEEAQARAFHLLTESEQAEFASLLRSLGTEREGSQSV
ncbi:MarR family winged helix-turn-helix transcriptional regulator [Nocardiopsis metallicus]|uniref:DNA-binding MarR family transcriptional regulator n=1 Tax=Nocardiopsis metallicus TaxID=179819 RepID=A0A840WC41_9ACTN|nr:MarR family transcriptional regulator [Nocardiopsis metallicus]MBB5490591.1 DNA-binding MarR family transcriptional regulator [Nocardiopsis metallicus]